MGFMVTKEMELLRDALTAKGIEWTDKSATNLADSWVCRTHYSYGGHIWSVIHGYGTYGGIGVYPYEGDEGLLECLTSKYGDIKGWLTAENVLALMEVDDEQS